MRVVGARGYKGALRRVEAVVMGKAVKELDLTEKMAFFEAYGAIAGRAGAPHAERHSAAARAAQAEAVVRHPRLRGHRDRQDPHTRGAGRAQPGRRRQGSRGPQRREPRAARVGGVTQSQDATRADARRRPPRRTRASATPGRGLLLELYAALRSLKLYPVENATVQKALYDLEASAEALSQAEGDIDVRLAGDFIFVNSTRLRLELDNYASFSHILTTFRAFEIGTLRVQKGADRREWQIFLSLLLSLSGRGEHRRSPGRAPAPDERGRRAAPRARARGSAAGGTAGVRGSAGGREAHLRQGVAVTKEVITGIRLGRATSVKRVKRAVQMIVDQVLNNETSLVGLTTMRDYDEYTFTHSVNVCIFAVALGKKLGFTKLQLYDLGMTALLHDVGKSRVPLDILNKTTGLDDDEWRIMQAHPWLGALTLFGLRGYDEIPYRSMLVAYEHHMKPDLTGYPQEHPPALARDLLPHRGGGRRVRCGDDAAQLPDHADRARPGAAGDVGESEARLRPDPGQGVHQPDRHLPRGHLRHPRHLRGRDRGRAESRRRALLNRPLVRVAIGDDGAPFLRRARWSIWPSATRAVAFSAPSSRSPTRPATASTSATTLSDSALDTAWSRLRATGRTALIPYLTAGFPTAEASLAALRAVAADADIIEVGVPFSDPLADGPTIQRSTFEALGTG